MQAYTHGPPSSTASPGWALCLPACFCACASSHLGRNAGDTTKARSPCSNEESAVFVSFILHSRRHKHSVGTRVAKHRCAALEIQRSWSAAIFSCCCLLACLLAFYFSLICCALSLTKISLLLLEFFLLPNIAHQPHAPEPLFCL